MNRPPEVARYLRVPAVHRIAHGMVLVHLPDGRLLELSGMAAMAWLVADEPGSLEELASRLAEDAPPLQHADGHLERSPEPGAPDEMTRALDVLVEAGVVAVVGG